MEPEDDRSPVAVAMSWASAIVTISVEMVIPGLVGHWLDRRWGTEPLLILLGVVCGMALATWQLVRLLANKR